MQFYMRQRSIVTSVGVFIHVLPQEVGKVLSSPVISPVLLLREPRPSDQLIDRKLFVDMTKLRHIFLKNNIWDTETERYVRCVDHTKNKYRKKLLRELKFHFPYHKAKAIVLRRWAKQAFDDQKMLDQLFRNPRPRSFPPTPFPVAAKPVGGKAKFQTLFPVYFDLAKSTHPHFHTRDFDYAEGSYDLSLPGIDPSAAHRVRFVPSFGKRVPLATLPRQTIRTATEQIRRPVTRPSATPYWSNWVKFDKKSLLEVRNDHAKALAASGHKMVARGLNKETRGDCDLFTFATIDGENTLYVLKAGRARATGPRPYPTPYHPGFNIGLAVKLESDCSYRKDSWNRCRPGWPISIHAQKATCFSCGSDHCYYYRSVDPNKFHSSLAVVFKYVEPKQSQPPPPPIFRAPVIPLDLNLLPPAPSTSRNPFICTCEELRYCRVHSHVGRRGFGGQCEECSLVEATREVGEELAEMAKVEPNGSVAQYLLSSKGKARVKNPFLVAPQTTQNNLTEFSEYDPFDVSWLAPADDLPDMTKRTVLGWDD